jgi:DeoR/GlpR family transcriptional regulator of sugar metabolism
MMKDASQKKRTARQIVLQAVIDLNEHNQPASRQRLVEITSLRPSTVDDQLHILKSDGLVRGVANGYYEYVDQTLDRAVSTTSLPHGRLKLEIGDDVVTNLTPREALALAKQLAGLLFAFGAMTHSGL